MYPSTSLGLPVCVTAKKLALVVSNVNKGYGNGTIFTRRRNVGDPESCVRMQSMRSKGG